MAIADTAQLVVELTLKDSLSSAATGVQGAMQKVESAAGRMGNALGHAGSQLEGLITGPLGLIGLGGGLFGLEQALSGSISKVDALGTAVVKLTALTGMSATESSTWIAILGRYGVDADTASTRFAFLEKTMGNLTLKSKTYSDFVNEYHFSLKNANGTVISVTTAMERLADVYESKTIPDSTKAALAAKLLGRGYVDMVPILALGSKGIADAADQAKALGLVLDAQNAGSLLQYHDSMLNLNEAVGGLQLQVGEALIPMLSTLATSATSWLASGGSKQIASWFQQGAQFAQDMGAAIKNDVLPVFNSIIGWWDSVPGDLKNLLIGAFVAQKASSWLFGGGGILGVLSGALSTGAKATGILGVQHVFVDNWAMMGGGGVGGVAGGAADVVGGAAAGEAGGGTVGSLIAGGGGVTLGSVAAPVGIGLGVMAGTAALGDAITAVSGHQQYGQEYTDPITGAKRWSIDPNKNGGVQYTSFAPTDPRSPLYVPPTAATAPVANSGASTWYLPGGSTESVQSGAGIGSTVLPPEMTADEHTRLNKAGSAGRKDLLRQLHGKYSGGRAGADSTAITTDYTSGAAYNNTSLANNIGKLVDLQKDAKEHGDTKTAASIGANIQTLRDLLSGKTMPAGKNVGPAAGSTWSLPGGGTETSGASLTQTLAQAVQTGFAAAQIVVNVSVRDVTNGQTTSTTWGAGKPQ